MAAAALASWLTMPLAVIALVAWDKPAFVLDKDGFQGNIWKVRKYI